MAGPILITGASGYVGGRIAQLLTEQGKPLRLMGRDLGKLPTLPNSETVQGDYAKPASLDDAFAGIDVAFIVSAYGVEGQRARLHKNAIDAAAQAGVNYVVYLSMQGASPESKSPLARDHAMTEAFLKESGMPFVALRDSLYLDGLPGLFKMSPVLKGAAGEGRVAWVARDDVARVAAAVLADPPHQTVTYDVTGLEALTFAESAARLSALVGRELRYEAETVEAGREWRTQVGMPAWLVDMMLGSDEAVAAGDLAAISDTVEQLTGTSPVAFEAYFEQHPQLLEPLQIE